MDMSEYKFTDQEIKTLIQQRDNQNNQRIRERLIAILMISQKIEVEIIAMLLGKTTKTIENWYKLYRNKGINELNSFNYKPKQPKLNFNEINQVIIWVIANNPGKVIQIKEYIKNKFNVDYTEDAIRKICDVIKKSYNKKIIVKLHPGHVSYDIKPLIHEIDPTIKIYQNENIADLLEKCDVMISLNFSTVILDALIAQKPTMVFLPEEQGFEDEIPLKKGAVLYTSNIDQFEKIINDLISNKKIRNELIHKGNDFVNEYFINKGNASNELAKILYSFEK